MGRFINLLGNVNGLRAKANVGGETGCVVILVDENNAVTETIEDAHKVLVRYNGDGGVKFSWHYKDDCKITGIQ